MKYVKCWQLYCWQL